MPAIWRPGVGQVLPDEDVEVGGDGARVEQGDEVGRAPPTKGPYEHGVKPRRSARCATLVRTGSGALSARSAVGSESASTVVAALYARSAVGLESASTVVAALYARSAVGFNLQHGRRDMQGVRWGSICEHGRHALSARSAVGLKSASTVVYALYARSAWRRNLRARSSALFLQGVRWVCNLRARS